MEHTLPNIRAVVLPGIYPGVRMILYNEVTCLCTKYATVISSYSFSGNKVHGYYSLILLYQCYLIGSLRKSIKELSDYT